MTGLPPTLERFGAELEHAVRSDLGARRRRRLAVRGAALLAAALAATLGVLSALPAGGPSVVQRAAAALEPSGDSILHFRFDAEQQNGDGTVATWSDETWQLRVAPFTRRQIAVDGSDGIRAESLTRGETNELYDAGRNTIYVATSEQLRAARMPKIEIVSKSKLARLTGSSRASAAYFVGEHGGVSVKVIATEEGARKLRQELAHGDKQRSGVLPEEFRAEIIALLESGRVRDAGHVQVDGRDAIRLESLDGKQVYVVDAATYDPIEWTSEGKGGRVTLRFPVYEQVPVDAESMQLLDLEAQHPAASVVRGPAAYISAEARLFPHG
jgi:hypothetical protein